MKNTRTVTKTLNKIWEMFDKIDIIFSFIRHERKDNAFTVTFSHDKDRKLLFIEWSDRWYGNDFAELRKKVKFVYTYSITSKGIHFEAFARVKDNYPWHNEYDLRWSTGASHENTIRLIDVPNNPPPDYTGKSMYLFHQDLIHEELSVLPAFAHAIMSL